MHENRRADSEPSWSKLYLDKVPMIKDSLKPHAIGRNVVGYYMLDLFAHPFACCCVLLGVVASVFTPLPTLTRQLSTF